MKVKIPTIIGIVLIFGYFIMESFRNPSSSDPSQVVMVGNDTLGRDWGAIADQKDREKAEAARAIAEQNEAQDNIGPKSLLGEEDPFARQKLSSDNYSTIQAADGREIITGYDPYQEEDENDPGNYQTRHQRETGRTNTEEPQMIYRE